MQPLVGPDEFPKAPRVGKTTARKPENVAAGRRIKERREQLNMTQQDLAAKVGITSVGPHEQGRSGFKGTTLADFARALGVTERWILHGDEEATGEHVEEHREDTAAWIQLEREGVIDSYRQQGVPESKIQHTRRIPGFRGGPGGATREEYLAHLDADLLGTVKVRHVPPEFARAREEVEREGGPDLGRHLQPNGPRKKDR